MSDLRERVAQAIAGTIGLEHMPSGTRNMYLRNADAAIALVLEEAARVAVDGPCGQPAYAWDYWCGYGNGKRAAAAAIRSLGGKDE